MISGIAIFTTSSGKRTIRSPLSENMTKMLKSKATSVMGLMRGIKRVRYHSSPLSRMRAYLVAKPGRKIFSSATCSSSLMVPSVRGPCWRPCDASLHHQIEHRQKHPRHASSFSAVPEGFASYAAAPRTTVMREADTDRSSPTHAAIVSAALP
jgi:hypothetical protein